jgi:ketosteroid isomerase-like protein
MSRCARGSGRTPSSRATATTHLLASEQRVAVIGRTTARQEDRHLVNDFVDVALVRDGLVAEVWSYSWNDAAITEFLAPTA